MATYQEPQHLGDLLLVEVQSGWTRERVTLKKAAGAYQIGEVVALASDKYQRFTGAETDLMAVVAEVVDASTADAAGVTVVRGAVVATDALIWGGSVTEVQKAAALAQLNSQGVVARDTL